MAPTWSRCLSSPTQRATIFLLAACIAMTLAQLVPANLYPILTPASRTDPQYVVGFLGPEYTQADALALLPPANYGTTPITVPLRVENRDYTCALPLRTPFGSLRSAAAHTNAGFSYPVPALSARPITQTFQKYSEPTSVPASAASAAAGSPPAAGARGATTGPLSLPVVPLDALLAAHPELRDHLRATAARAAAATDAGVAAHGDFTLATRIPATLRASVARAALSGVCLLHDGGYWQYSVCPFANVTQYRRADGAASGPIETEFILGRYAMSSATDAALPDAFAKLAPVHGVRGGGTAAPSWSDVAAQQQAVAAASAATAPHTETTALPPAPGAHASPAASAAQAAAEAAAAARAAEISARPADYLERWVRDLMSDVGAGDDSLQLTAHAHGGGAGGAGGLTQSAAALLEAMGFDPDVIVGAAGADGTAPAYADGDHGDGGDDAAAVIGGGGAGAGGRSALGTVADELAALGLGSLTDEELLRLRELSADIIVEAMERGAEAGEPTVDVDAVAVVEDAAAELGYSLRPPDAVSAVFEAESTTTAAGAAHATPPAASAPAAPTPAPSTPAPSTHVPVSTPAPVLPAASAIPAERTLADEGIYTQFYTGGTSNRNTRVLFKCPEVQGPSESGGGVVRTPPVPGTRVVSLPGRPPAPATTPTVTLSAAAEEEHEAEGEEEEEGEEGWGSDAADADGGGDGTVDVGKAKGTTHAAPPAGSGPGDRASRKSQTPQQKVKPQKPALKQQQVQQQQQQQPWEAWIAAVQEPAPHDYVIMVITDAVCPRALAALAPAPVSEAAAAAAAAGVAVAARGRALRLPAPLPGAGDAASDVPAAAGHYLEAGRLLSRVAAKGCLTHNAGWWTYTLCPGKDIVQFHVHVEQSGPGKGQQSHSQQTAQFKTTASYGLGAVPSGPLPPAPASVASATHTASTPAASTLVHEPVTAAWARSIEVVKAGRWTDNYVAQWYEGGTPCDDGSPRRTEVRYYCPPNGKSKGPAQITAVSEVASCVYVIEVNAPLMCGFSITRPEQLVFSELVCYPDADAFADGAAVVTSAGTDVASPSASALVSAGVEGENLGAASRAVPTSTAAAAATAADAAAAGGSVLLSSFSDPASSLSSTLLSSARVSPKAVALGAVGGGAGADAELAALIQRLWAD